MLVVLTVLVALVMIVIFVMPVVLFSFYCRLLLFVAAREFARRAGEWGKGCNVTLKKVMKIVPQRAGPPFWVPERCLNLTFGSLWVPYGPIVPPRLIFKGF